MSEKRFKFYSDDYLVGIIDTVTGKKLNHFATIDLLNEQQATIKRLEEENDDLRFALRTEQAFARVEKDKKPFLSKEEFFKELEEDE